MNKWAKEQIDRIAENDADILEIVEYLADICSKQADEYLDAGSPIDRRHARYLTSLADVLGLVGDRAIELFNRRSKSE